MIAAIHISQEIFPIDILTALKPSLKLDRSSVTFYDYMGTRLKIVTIIFVFVTPG